MTTETTTHSTASGDFTDCGLVIERYPDGIARHRYDATCVECRRWTVDPLPEGFVQHLVLQLREVWPVVPRAHHVRHLQGILLNPSASEDEKTQASLALRDWVRCVLHELCVLQQSVVPLLDEPQELPNSA